ncbi:MAG: hypothetical protein ACI8QC_002782 [Planctomycetota bacterium]|jgi:uncharacterized protein (DUF58 family)
MAGLLMGLSLMCMVAAMFGLATLGLVTAGTFGLLVLGPLLARRNLAPLLPALPKPLIAVAGQPTRWSLALENQASRSSRDVRVVLDEGRREVGALAAGQCVELPGEELVTLELRPRFTARGRRHSIDLELRSSWPFGWLEERQRWRVPVDLTVLPRVVRLCPNALQQRQRDPGQLQVLGRLSHEGEVYALREWREGEGLRHVHWKLSAHRGRRIATERREEAQPSFRLHLITALGPTPPLSSGAFETALVLAASLLAHHAAGGSLVQLIIDTAAPLDARTPSDLISLMRRLAELQPSAGSIDTVLAKVPSPARGEVAWALCAAPAGTPPLGVELFDSPESSLLELRLQVPRGARRQVARGSA